jgi:predicted aspartyl protease
MITGIVNANREAILRLIVRDANGQEHERDAVVDTGFDGWLSLPPDFISTLGLRWHRFGRAVLADGSESKRSLRPNLDDVDKAIKAVGDLFNETSVLLLGRRFVSLEPADMTGWEDILRVAWVAQEAEDDAT